MPRKLKVPCGHSGCAMLIESGAKYCEQHKALHPEAIRSASSRGYTSKWQRESKRFLQSHPLCVECMKQGRYTKATVVDQHRRDEAVLGSEQLAEPL